MAPTRGRNEEEKRASKKKSAKSATPRARAEQVDEENVIVRYASLLALAACAGGHLPPRVAPVTLERICVEGEKLVTCSSRQGFRPHGFNYDHDRSFRLLEDYWASDWRTVAEDFREMHDLGANVVRVHFQIARFMRTETEIDAASLQRFDDLVHVAEQANLHLLVTGLATYRPADTPRWYDDLDEAARWKVQARFWTAIASRAARSQAIFAYDLMNEPVVPGEPQAHWANDAALDGLHFIQHITRDRAGRSPGAVALEWAKLQSSAIRSADRRALVTIGMLPVFAGFGPADVAPAIDFQSVHLYPESGHEADTAAVLTKARTNMPVLVEESGPIRCSVQELEQFMVQNPASGWLGFYWGASPMELRASTEPRDALLLGWLEMFSKH